MIGSKIYVYCDNIYLETLKVGVVSSSSDIVFPAIFDDTDDAEAKTGIYSDLNMFLNPGFEDAAEGEDMVGLDMHIPAVWQSENFGLEGATSKVYTYYDPNTWGTIGDEVEGKGALQHHGWGGGAAMYFFQELETKLESNTVYSLSFVTWNHGDTYTGTYTAKFGYDENDGSIASITWSQPTDSAYQMQDHKFVFQTYDVDSDKPVYFTITRNNNVIAHFDRMTLVKATSSSIKPGMLITGASSVMFEEGTGYAPEVVLADNQIFDFSSFIVNPDITSISNGYATGWSGNTWTTWGNAFTGSTNYYYLDGWNGNTNLNYNCYQTITGLKNGVYRLQAAARTNDDGFVIYASSKGGEFTTPLINQGGGGDDDQSELGLGWNIHTVDGVKVIDGTLTIGGKGVSLDFPAWLSLDEFRLYYVGSMTNLEMTDAFADFLSQYIIDAGDKIYNIRENLTGIYLSEFKDLQDETALAVANTARTYETIEVAYEKLSSSVSYAEKFNKVTNDILQIIAYTEEGYIESTTPEIFIEPIVEAMNAYTELTEHDDRTLEQLEAVYTDLKTAYDFALTVQGSYGHLMLAIEDAEYLASICNNANVKMELDELIMNAKAVLEDELSSAEDYELALPKLNNSIITIYKGYESEDFTSDLLNPGCDADTYYSAPDGWTISIGTGNQYSNSGQHYSVLSYLEGTDDYNEAVSNVYLDSWNGTAGSMIYTATSIFVPCEPGLHILKAAARADGTGAYIFINDKTTEIPVNGGAGGELGNGWSYVEVPFIVNDDMIDKDINFGAKTVSGWTGTWFSADDFEVHHYPAAVALLAINDVKATDDVTVYIADGKVVVNGAETYMV